MHPESIQRLADPSIYPERPESVEIIQTHLSVVVLAGDAAYKFKKPVRLPFADFSTLEKRLEACRAEVDLNRRLCPEIYLGVVALTARGIEPQAGRSDAPVDWAVKMRRLPQDRMLDRLLAAREVGPSEVESIAIRIAAFHRTARRGGEVDALGDPGRLRDFALANFSETRDRFHPSLHRELERRTKRDFADLLPELKERVARGCVIDGHGDLHARNICLVDPPAIYDCIEFNPAFRCGDVATEHAFLAMDLRYREHPALAARYLDAVEEESGDRDLRALVNPLLRYRAMVRAKVSAIAAGEAELGEEARRESAQAARRYMRLAAASASEESGPRWILFCGLPGAGKSVVAEALAAASGSAWPMLSSDRVRKELAGAGARERLPDACYADGFSRRTYDELLARACAETVPGRAVILDANFRSGAERARFREAARERGARCEIVHVLIDPEQALARLREREAGGQSESDAGPEVFEKLRREFEAPAKEEADRLISLPGEFDPDDAVESLLADLLRH